MIKILFICHGNICRSPMAEFIMKKLVADRGLGGDFYIESAAVSREETGNDIYPPAKRKLTEKGVPFTSRRARTVTDRDFEEFDHIIVMDGSNLRILERNFPYSDKVCRLSDFSDGADVADPWYSGDFERAFDDIYKGCLGLLDSLMGNLENRKN